MRFEHLFDVTHFLTARPCYKTNARSGFRGCPSFGDPSPESLLRCGVGELPQPNAEPTCNEGGDDTCPHWKSVASSDYFNVHEHARQLGETDQSKNNARGS